MKRMKRKFFAALLACALCAVGAFMPGGALVPERAWADVKIDAENFPDEKFRQWVKEEAAGGKDVLTDEQIAAVTEIDFIFYGVYGLTSLKGLEHFTALKSLNCSNNQLTKLDLSKNAALEELRCYGGTLEKLILPNSASLGSIDCSQNRLTELDLSGVPELTHLTCNDNGLTELDLIDVSELTSLNCGRNELTELDLSDSPKLEGLDCRENQLTELDLSKNEKLEEAALPAAAAVTLPNGDRIDMADFQLRRTAEGKYQLDLSKYAGKIEDVLVYIPGVVEDEEVPVTSSGGVYTFDSCDGYGSIYYKLGDRGEDEAGWSLHLPLSVMKDTSSAPLAEPKAKADPNATEDIVEDIGAAGGREAVEAPKVLSLTLTNKTEAKVHVALAYPNGAIDDDSSNSDVVYVSKGWWTVEPGKTRTLYPCEWYDHKLDDDRPVYFIYATSMNDTRIWGGSKDDPAYAVDLEKSFEAHGNKLPGGKRVRFIPLQVSKEGEAALDLTASKSPGGIPAEIAGNRVNIRQKPDRKGKVLFQLNEGDPVEATGETVADDDGGLWFQIKTPSGKTGWVFSDYIRDRRAALGARPRRSAPKIAPLG